MSGGPLQLALAWYITEAPFTTFPAHSVTP